MAFFEVAEGLKAQCFGEHKKEFVSVYYKDGLACRRKRVAWSA
jgi:hypothetical protein